MYVWLKRPGTLSLKNNAHNMHGDEAATHDDVGTIFSALSRSVCN